MAVATLPTFPTVNDVLVDIQSKVQALNSLLTNFNPGGVTQTYIDSMALLSGSDASAYPGALQKGTYELLAMVQAGAFILSATGTYLDAKAADVGVFRKLASPATGPGFFSLAAPSLTDTLIPKNSVVQAESADPTAMPLLYKTTADVVIPAGQLDSPIVGIVCTQPGSNGDQIPGAVKIVISAPTGVSFVNTNYISGGSDTEQDDEPNGGLRARALAAIPNAVGTIVAIQEDALTFASIISSYLLENTDDDGVTRLKGRGQLYVDDGSGNLGDTGNPNHGVLAVIQGAFDNGQYRAAGTQVHVVGSTLLHVSVVLFVQINAVYAQQHVSEDDLKTAVAEAVSAYVNGLAIGRPILVAEIVRVATEIQGVSNVIVSSVLINGTAGDFATPATQTPRIVTSAADSVTVDSALVIF